MDFNKISEEIIEKDVGAKVFAVVKRCSATHELFFELKELFEEIGLSTDCQRFVIFSVGASIKKSGALYE